MPSYQLRGGERPPDGIVAPCGPYTGKYTVDYEYVQGFEDLHECNGTEAQISIETALGTETFGYYYVVTSEFHQIGRCHKESVSLDFENSAEPTTNVDADGYLSQFECDDNNPDINPSAVEIPNNGIDEDCDGLDFLSPNHQLANTTIDIYPNPTAEIINIDINGQLKYKASIYSLDENMISSVTNSNQTIVTNIPWGIYIVEIRDLNFTIRNRKNSNK